MDDDAAIVEVLRTFLEMEGYPTEAFTDPLEARQRIEGEGPRPSLLITDYKMPGLNGGQILKIFKEQAPEIHTILISGYLEDITIGNLEVRPDRVLAKPFNPQQLVSQVRELLADPAA